MSDFGRKIADKKIKKVDRQLRAEFRQAEKELNEKLADFVAKHQAAGQKKWQQLVNDEITQAEYHSWMRGQVFQQKQWEAKVRQCQEILHEHNVQAAKIVHENKLDVFAECYDHAAYESELETGISFNLINKEAVARLTKERPQLLPEWKIDQPKDYKWNARKVNNAITQGIIQGESVDKIAKRLTKQLCTANEKKMRMFARTAMAGAMCGGEQKQMEDVATRLKIDILKEWLATLDSRTRDVHRQLDGQQVPYDEPFQSDLGAIMFPGDPKAELGNICNCRCDMVKRYPKFMKVNDWRQQEIIDGQSYEEWKKGKQKDFFGFTTSMDMSIDPNVTVPKKMMDKVEEAVNKITEKVPVLKKYIRDIEYTKVNQVGKSSMDGKEIKLDKRAFSSERALKKVLEDHIKSGHSVDVDDPMFIVAHEAGHSLESYVVLKRLGLLNAQLGELQKQMVKNEKKRIGIEYFTHMGFTDETTEEIYDIIGKELGSRALVNPSEMAAQALGQVLYGKKKAPHAEKLVDYLLSLAR